jgi:hypothetical protein
MATNVTNDRSSSNSIESNTDSDNSPPFAMVEWFWRPEKGWHALRAEAAENALEWPTTRVDLDPETILWYKRLEDALTDGSPKMGDVDLELAERMWQDSQKDAKAVGEDPGGLSMSTDPDEIRWHRVLQESITAGKAEIVPPDLELVERIWQKNFIHPKLMHRRYFSCALNGC